MLNISSLLVMTITTETLKIRWWYVILDIVHRTIHISSFLPKKHTIVKSKLPPSIAMRWNSNDDPHWIP